MALEEPLSKIISVSNVMQDIKRIIVRTANISKPVLIIGEKGTGKELIAQAIHALSTRKNKPFTVLNSLKTTTEFFDVELFGFNKGFMNTPYHKTGILDQAMNGTFFIRNIHELSKEKQGLITGILQDGYFARLGGIEQISCDIKFIASVCPEIEDLVKNNTFRSDLFYRLHIIPIHVPPLRNRLEDIPNIIDALLKELNCNITINQKVIDLFLKYNWPGNILELKSILERITYICPYNYIKIEDLPEDVLNKLEGVDDKPNILPMLPVVDTIDNVEASMLIEALRKTRGNQSRAAVILGITRRALGYRINKYKIELSNYKKKNQV